MAEWTNTLLVGVDLLVVCGLILWLHWMSPRYGLAPLMLCLSAVVAIVHTLGALGVYVRAPNDLLLIIGSTVLVPAALLGILVIYVVQGTTATRITIFGVLGVSVLALGLHLVHLQHVALPGGGNLAGLPADSSVLSRSPALTGASLLAFALALSAVAIVYQGLTNAFPRSPAWLTSGVALLAALWTDAAVFRAGAFGIEGLMADLPTDLAAKGLSAIVMWPLAGWYVEKIAPTMPGYAEPRDRGVLDLIMGTYGRQAEVLSLAQAARRTTEAALRRAQAQLATVISNAPIVFFALDAEGRFTLSEGKGLEQLNLKAGQVVGHSVFDLYPEFAGDVRRALAGETVTSVVEEDGLVWETTFTPIHDADGVVQGVSGVATDLTERIRAERAMQESERRFRSTFEQAAVGIAHVALDGRFLRVNQRLADMLGYSREELRALDFQSVTHAEDVAATVAAMAAIMDGRENTFTREKRYVRKDGAIVWANLTAALLRDGEDRPAYFVSVVEDITARKATEEQLRQAQKMEVVGQLTGGVAHDFNNLMTVIMGGLELARDDVRDRPHASQALDSALEATRRGAALTQRLLAFSRKQTLRPSAIDVRALLGEMTDLLVTSLGETITLRIRLDDDLWTLSGDRPQLENTILNLTLNARDAMPLGGSLTIRGTNRTLRPDEAERIGIGPGDYVLLDFTDDGEGMAPHTLEHAFEPFFTTKDVGKGSGLGLSMVYGFANQSGGHVRIESAVGTGTTVRLYMPRASRPRSGVRGPDNRVPLAENGDPRGSGQTILVVEDDPDVRRLVVRLLDRLGYRCVEAEDGMEALGVLESRRDVDLLFTDIVLPRGMTGADLAQEALARWPDLRVVYTSGYSRDALSSKGRLTPGVALVEKPFEKSQLATVLSDALSR